MFWCYPSSFSTTRPYNTRGGPHSSPTHLYNTDLQDSSPTLPPYTTLFSSPTLLYNTLQQSSLPHNTSLQHSSPTLELTNSITHLYVWHVAKLYCITNENNLSTGSRRISLTSGHTQPHPLSWAGPATCRGGRPQSHSHTTSMLCTGRAGGKNSR